MFDCAVSTQAAMRQIVVVGVSFQVKAAANFLAAFVCRLFYVLNSRAQRVNSSSFQWEIGVTAPEKSCQSPRKYKRKEKFDFCD